MLEFLFCSMLTILPDYLVRRYAQGKRIGQEITLFSVWYELRWGITACAMLTIALITTVFYFHPSTKNAASFFRTVTILPETGGRVAEVMVANNQKVEAGTLLFRLDDARQQSAFDTAQTKLAEIDAQIDMGAADLAAAAAQVAQVQAQLTEAETELARTQALKDRGSAAVSEQDLDRNQARADSARAALAADRAQEDSARTRAETLLPAQKVSAMASMEQAQVELDLTSVYAGVDGTLEQFGLQVGDYVNPILRPAGIIVPAASGRTRIQAGFGQLAAQVIKPGMIAEVSCFTKPFTIIPMVVVQVQDVIAGGEIRPTDQLVDAEQRARPGSITVIMEPLYEGGLTGLLPGSRCVANAYTSNHERLASGEVSGLHAVALHAVDAVGLVHAIILRIQALLFPVQNLVLSGGH